MAAEKKEVAQVKEELLVNEHASTRLALRVVEVVKDRTMPRSLLITAGVAIEVAGGEEGGGRGDEASTVRGV